ncbi:MAG: MMPL family transporter, partial [Halieaceae bacterium]|nr:MMPL family transporter [Halieaceae bacterium]
RDQATTALAISLSAATSILAFGLLGFSETPVISSFGQTIAVGLVFAWLFSWMRLTNWEPS